MAKTTTARLGQTRWSSGTDTVRRLDFDTDAANLENSVAIYGQGLVSARPAAGVQGRYYSVTGESDAKLNGRIYYDDGTIWRGPRFLTDGYAESTANGNTALVVKSFTTPTADIFKVTNSTESTTHLRVTSTGVTSNQSTVGSTGGVYFGNSSTHDAAASLISVATDKPVLLIKAATSQSASLISARDSNNATVFSLSATGSAIFNSSVQASSITSTGAVNASTISSTTSLTTKNLVSNPLNANSVAATFTSFSSHLNNIVNIEDASGNRIARINSEGSYATNARVLIGGNAGSGTDPVYSNTTPALSVNNPFPSAVAVKIMGNASQSAKLLDIANNADVSKFSVDNNGNMLAAGNSTLTTATVGSGSTPTQYFNGFVPKFEVNTGTEAGTYNQAVTIRHTTMDSSVVTRSLGLHLKMSNESTPTESDKWAGIAAVSTLGFANSPALVLYSAGSEAARLDADKNFTVGGDVQLSTAGKLKTGGGLRSHWLLSTDETNSIGLQTNTMYMRSPNFAWFAGGTHNDAQFGPGVNGALVMSLTSGADARLSVNRLSILQGQPFNSTQPSLSIGDLAANHMQFSTQSINSFSDASKTPGTLNIQQSGGILNLGNTVTDVVIASRVVRMGANRVFFGGSTFTPGSPQHNDWWFDHTNESVKVRRSDNTWFNVAGTG